MSSASPNPSAEHRGNPNPYASPRLAEEPRIDSNKRFSTRDVLLDSLIGSLVGATYGALGGAVLVFVHWVLVGSVIWGDGIWQSIEALFLATVVASFAGAALGAVLGGLMGGLLSAACRATFGIKSYASYWLAVLCGSMVAALSAIVGTNIAFGVDLRSPASSEFLVALPISGVMGGIFGALAGQKWGRLVSLPKQPPDPQGEKP